MSNQFICSVAKVLSPTQLVINKGSNAGLKEGLRFLIYQLSDDDIIDPITKQSLGKLEIVKGTGKIVHLQDTMATIESDQYEKKQPRKVTTTSSPNRVGLILDPYKTVEEIDPGVRTQLPFDNPQVGDFAKQIP